MPNNERTAVRPAALATLINPASVAVVGARESSRWCQMFMANLPIYRFAGKTHLINRHGGAVYGHIAATSCEQIGEPVDVAVLMMRREDTRAALADLAAADIRAAVVLGGGYREAGPSGAALEAALVADAEQLGITLIGPNCLGLANLLDRVPVWVAPIPQPYIPGPIALISQSGNIAQAAAGLAASQGIGLSHIVSTGNEAMTTASDVLCHVLEDDRVRAIAMFAESIRDPASFASAANRAADLGKPIVMLKVGRSAIARRLAATHTGALAGDDQIIDGAFRSLGVIRVSSLEQLVATAGLLAHTGPLPAGGLGVVSVSGGSNDIVADRAAELGLGLPALATETLERIAPHSGPTTLDNPLDVGGDAGRNEVMWVETCSAMSDDPGIAIVIASFSRLAHALSPSSDTIDEERLGWVSRGLNRDGGRRSALMLNTLQPVSVSQLDALARIDAPHVLGGIEHGLAAIADAMRWSTWLRRVRARPPADATTAPSVEAAGGWPEWRVLELLAAAGVPVAPWYLADSKAVAAAAAVALGYPVVAKVSSPEILHKSRLGGVQVDIRNPDELDIAFEEVLAAARREDAEVDGVLVAKYLPGGAALLLGTIRDPLWGGVLLLGEGGVDAESLARTTTRLLPVDAGDVSDMLTEMAALTNRREFADADSRFAATQAILAFAQLATSLGDTIQSLEVNPLRVRGGEVHALDGVITWVDA